MISLDFFVAYFYIVGLELGYGDCHRAQTSVQRMVLIYIWLSCQRTWIQRNNNKTCHHVIGFRCHVLTLVPLWCLCFSMVRAWVGWEVYVLLSMIWYFCVWPGMVLNQRQLSIVVPDWEPYLGSLFFNLELWVIIFSFISVPDRTVSVSFRSLVGFVF